MLIMSLRIIALALSSAMLLAGTNCNSASAPRRDANNNTPAPRVPQKTTLEHGPTQDTKPVGAATPSNSNIAGYTVITRYPHDCTAFTQGFEIRDGVFYESTGRHGYSSLRRVKLDTGQIEQKTEVPEEFFAEGATVLNDRIYQLTWQNQKGFVYDRATLRKLRDFKYEGEGWGLTNDGRSLIMSDGITPRLRFLNPETFQVERTLTVNDEKGQPLLNLNELEFVKGEIYANVWQTNRIARIDPASGKLLGWLDLTGLDDQAKVRPANPTAPCPTPDVLNGIAYDAAHDRLFVTGKLWPYIYEIKINP